MKTNRFKSRKITALLSAIMLTEQLASTGAVLYAHAEDVAPAEYTIEHNVTSSWDGGCSAEIILTNQAEVDTENWSVTFCTRDEITNLWGGKITECEELLVSDASVEMDDVTDAEEVSEMVEETESEETATDEVETEEAVAEETTEEESTEETEEIEEAEEETDTAEEVEEVSEDEVAEDAVEEETEDALEEELLEEERLEEELEAEEESEEEDNLYYRYIVEALDYNAVIPAGGSITIGYNANGEDHEIWDAQAEFTYAAEEVIEESLSNEKGVSNDWIEDTTYLFEGDDYAVRYTVKSHWEGFCNVEIQIENRSDVKKDNWNLTFYTEDDIRNVYNAQIVVNDSEEGRVTLKNSGYNQDIPANGSVSFGFEIAYGERFDRPEAFCLGNEEAIVPENEYIFTNSIQSEWDEGCIGAITIQNISTEAIEDWSLIIHVDGSISSVWDGNLKELGDGIYEIECPDHSQNILVGGNVSIGYQATKNTEITLVELREKNAGLNGQGTTVSGNGIASHKDAEQHIFIDTEEFRFEDDGVYFVDDEVAFVEGHTDFECEFESATLIIEDVFGEVVWEGDIASEDGFQTWSIDEIGLLACGNILIFTLTDVEGEETEEIIVVINSELANMERTLVGLADTDNDGIYDYFEKYYGTDPLKADTDDDGLSDDEELFVLFTDPSNADTDGNGIVDSDEDHDNDGLKVIRENELGTSDWCADSDADGLKDYDEVNNYGTDPMEYDTDQDGFSDGEEITLGLNPFSKDSDGDGTPDGEEVFKQTRTCKVDEADNAVKAVSVSIDCKGSVLEQVHVIENQNTIIGRTPGIIGKPMDIEADFDFDTAEISFTYDESMLGSASEEDLRIMWYNEADNEYVLLEDSVCDPENNTVTYTTTHFSTYFLMDGGVWREYSTEPIDYTGYTKIVKENYDFIVFIDYTVSEEDLALEEKIASSIIAQMEDGDRMFFYYVVSDNLNMITDKNGNYSWATTKEQALNHMNPNYGLSPLALFMMGGYSTSNTYDGRADLSIEALNYPASNGNKKIGYLFYPGSSYDSTFQKYASDMTAQTTKAASAGSVLHAIPLDGTPSAELHQYISNLGGKQYVGDDVTVMDAIEKGLSQRIELSDGQVDMTDTDGDGLLDVWETKGMRAANGVVVYSDPNLRDSDYDGYKDNEEIGEYDSVNGTFRVYSDPNDSESTPHTVWPVYIIAWSYNKSTIRRFEYNETNQLYFEFLHPNDDNSEWTEAVFMEFERTDGFSRAAQTRKRELIASGVDPRQVIIKRIDGDWDGGGCNNLQHVWNNEWTDYQCIKELHMYTHGYNGYPYMYNSERSVIWNTNFYSKLSWDKDGAAYFHGCHTATLFVPDADDIRAGYTSGNYYPLQRFADAQGVDTYGNKYGTSLSSSPTEHLNIDYNPSYSVYLRTYEIPRKEADGTDDPNLSYVPMKCFTPQ